MMESIRDNGESGKALEKLSLAREKVESMKRAKMQGGESGSRSSLPHSSFHFFFLTMTTK